MLCLCRAGIHASGVQKVLGNEKSWRFIVIYSPLKCVIGVLGRYAQRERGRERKRERKRGKESQT